MDKVILNYCVKVDVIIAMAMMMIMMIEIAMMKLKNMLRFIDDFFEDDKCHRRKLTDALQI